MGATTWVLEASSRGSGVDLGAGNRSLAIEVPSCGAVVPLRLVPAYVLSNSFSPLENLHLLPLNYVC